MPLGPANSVPVHRLRGQSPLHTRTLLSASLVSYGHSPHQYHTFCLSLSLSSPFFSSQSCASHVIRFFDSACASHILAGVRPGKTNRKKKKARCERIKHEPRCFYQGHPPYHYDFHPHPLKPVVVTSKSSSSLHSHPADQSSYGELVLERLL
jgi:hypothetical protein